MGIWSRRSARVRDWLRVRPALRLATTVALCVVPISMWIGAAARVRHTGFDLRYAFLPAAHDVLRGVTPYPAAWDPAVHHQTAYVYTPFVAFVLAPLTAVPVNVAVGLGLFGSGLAVLAILWILGIRDWRCYLAAMIWSPVGNSLSTLAISVPLALLLALAWRTRESGRLSGALLGCAVAAKVFVWPVLVWQLATRRVTAVVIGVCTAVAIALGSWAAIGFAGFSTYPSLLRTVTSLEEANSYSISGMLENLGLDVSSARLVAFAVTAALLVSSLRFGLRGDDRRSFTAAVLAALASTPILWQHYLVFLLVVLAIARPRMSAAWLLPIALWLSPFDGNGNLFQTSLVQLCVVSIGVVCLAPRRRAQAQEDPAVVLRRVRSAEV